MRREGRACVSLGGKSNRLAIGGACPKPQHPCARTSGEQEKKAYAFAMKICSECIHLWCAVEDCSDAHMLRRTALQWARARTDVSTRLTAQSMSTAAIPPQYPNNHVFGDSLVHREELPGSNSPALQFQVQATSGPQARTAQMQLPHFLCETPMFMPVGTKGALSTSDLRTTPRSTLPSETPLATASAARHGCLTSRTQPHDSCPPGPTCTAPDPSVIASRLVPQSAAQAVLAIATVDSTVEAAKCRHRERDDERYAARRALPPHPRQHISPWQSARGRHGRGAWWPA